jgi:5-formyltetrahydrofolate cyclo-ligase
MDIIDQKKLLRTKIRKLLADFPKDQKIIADEKIRNNLINFPLYKNAQSVCFYYSTDQEVDTRNIIESELKQKIKQIILPRISGNHLDLYEIKSISDLEKNKWDLWEPKITCRKVDINEVDLFIVPGLAFDKDGWRLGRRMGFYDRLLREVRKPKIAICYNFQLIDNIPHDENDIAADYIIK